MRAPGEPALNASIWIAAVAAAALLLHRRAGLSLTAGRLAWLTIGVLFAAGLAWRAAPALKLLALGSAALAFAIAAHRRAGSWVRRAGVARYAAAAVLGAVHTGTAPVLALVDLIRFRTRGDTRAAHWGTAMAMARGLAVAAPLLAVFAALFISADAAFERLVLHAFRFDIEWTASHVALWSVCAWISTGYLRASLTGTDTGDRSTQRWASLGPTETITALGAIAVLFLAFVLVQIPYLFGAHALVQATPDLTYAEYARSGFFELVAAVALVVPMLLAADWLLDPSSRRGLLWFRLLALAQIALVLAIAASALHRLRLYYASYGLTESRFYAMVLLIWAGAILVWLGATVLRGRRDRFAFGGVASGLVAIALLFAINPGATIARANVARVHAPGARVSFDAAYAASLGADAVPVLLSALPSLPADAQCPLALHLLRRWPADRPVEWRAWNWSERAAAAAVRRHEPQLLSIVGSQLACVAQPAAITPPAR